MKGNFASLTCLNASTKVCNKVCGKPATCKCIEPDKPQCLYTKYVQLDACQIERTAGIALLRYIAHCVLQGIIKKLKEITH